MISTGGTFQLLASQRIPVLMVSDVTSFPEILEGRVKTLHPLIYGGILAKPNDVNHLQDLKEHSIRSIQLVVVNLYPFGEVVSNPRVALETALENIDIGGVTLIRAAAKNFENVLVIVDPEDYGWIIERLMTNTSQTTSVSNERHDAGVFDCFSLDERKRMALKAFQYVLDYDTAIVGYFSRLPMQISPECLSSKKQSIGELSLENNGYQRTNSNPRYNDNNDLSTPKNSLEKPELLKCYERRFTLKYGCNPHQIPSAVYTMKGNVLPFRVLNGSPGYINLLDALNAWQAVKELKAATGLSAAASFKHVSPAGIAVAIELTSEERQVYEVGERELTPPALAYVRARQSDPMCSYGDFAALSDPVDDCTAKLLKGEVCDGIIAPGFSKKSLELLCKKKGGNFLILEANLDYEAELTELREIFGVALMQRRNSAMLTKEMFCNPSQMSSELKGDLRVRVVTNVEPRAFPEIAIRDLLVAHVAAKYSQSNSVVLALQGQTIGVGVGQQSRVDCTRLAAHKAQRWHLRFHTNMQHLSFRPGTSRVNRINLRNRLLHLEDSLSNEDRSMLLQDPLILDRTERSAWTKRMQEVALVSDAFFPFEDSIQVAASAGVRYILQPGGGLRESAVIQACETYGIIMANSGLRLFHH